MKLKRKTTQLICLSLLMIFVVFGAVFWGFFQHIRYDEIALTKPGYSLNEDFETIQFISGSDLYRSWNDNEIIESPNGDKTYLPQYALIYFDDGDILFTDEATKIDTNGKGEGLNKRVIYQQTNREFKNAKKSIEANNIVKVANRNYFFNGTGDIYLNDEKITTVTNPQLLIDRAGSVTVYSEQTKERYLGHLKIQVSDSIYIDVSDEMYYVGDREIDLTKFGGSDNEKYLIDKMKDQNDSDSEDEQDEDSDEMIGNGVTLENGSYSKKYDENSILGNKENGKDSTTGSVSEKNGGKSSLSDEEQLALLDDYDSIMKLLEKINSNATKQIPTMYMLSNQPKSVSATLSIWANDESDSLVGPVEVQVWSALTDKVVATQYIKKGQNRVEITGLSPNEEYYLGYKYQYDLGDGKGIKTLSMKDENNIFQTLSVSAIYTVTQINSKSIEATVALDAPVDEIKSADLLVIDAKTGETLFSKALDGNKIVNGGENMTITGLEANAPYRFKLELVYGENLAMSFEQSQIYYTSSMPKLVSSKVSVNELDQYSVDYLWSSGDYTASGTKFQLVGTKDQQVIPLEASETTEGELLLIPNSKQYQFGKSYEVQLLIEATAPSGKKETLIYTLPNSFQKVTVAKLEKEKKSISLEVDNLPQKQYVVSLQRKTNQAGSRWKEIERLELGTDTNGNLKIDFESNELELAGFDYRVVMYDQAGKIIQYIY